MLIKVAICEDNIYDQQEVVRYLKIWEKQSGHEVNHRFFANTSELLIVNDGNYENYDVYILDIYMKAPKEGLELAQKIRHKHEDIPIIFITSHSELILESNEKEIFALRFLTKPIDESIFFSTLNRLARSLEKRDTSFFTYSFSRHIKRQPLRKVIFLETDASDRHFILINGDTEQRFRGTLSGIVEKYPDDLIICHQGCAVNVEHMRSLKANTLKLSDGSEVAVSRANLQSVQQRFGEFYSFSRKEK